MIGQKSESLRESSGALPGAQQKSFVRRHERAEPFGEELSA
jgi:hypothetical protein